MPQTGNKAKMGRTTRKGLAWLKRERFTVDIIPHTRWHQDLFHIADAVAIRDSDMWLVQFRTNALGDMKIFDDFFSKHKVNIIVIMFKDREKEPYLRIWSRFPKDFFSEKN
jgi:hypothetical protein